jgi:hypothetical protein
MEGAMRLITLTVLACSIVAGSAQAAALKPGDWVYDQTASALDKAANRDLREPEDQTDDGYRAPDSWGIPPARMFTRLDVNQDGVDDWRVDYEHAPNASLWCGTGGCRNEIWVSEPGHHHTRVMEVGVRDFKLSRKRGVTRLDLDFHGTVCEGFGAQECPRSYVWNEGGFEPAPTRDGRTWLAGGPAMLVAARRQDMPALAAAALERLQALCTESGGTYDADWGVQSIPDIDGDGLEDWVVGGRYANCEYDNDHAGAASPAITTQIFATAGSLPEGRLAYEQRGLAWGIDIGSRPAAFYAYPGEGGPACEYEKPCGTRLRYDAASGRLVE